MNESKAIKLTERILKEAEIDWRAFACTPAQPGRGQCHEAPKIDIFEILGRKAPAHFRQFIKVAENNFRFFRKDLPTITRRQIFV